MKKWFNNLRPITLSFLIMLLCYSICLGFAYLSEDFILLCKVSSALCLLMFFLFWAILAGAESSQCVYDEIRLLYSAAKNVKTKAQLNILESDYNTLRNKAQHRGHSQVLREIYQILETKREFIQ